MLVLRGFKRINDNYSHGFLHLTETNNAQALGQLAKCKNKLINPTSCNLCSMGLPSSGSDTLFKPRAWLVYLGSNEDEGCASNLLLFPIVTQDCIMRVGLKKRVHYKQDVCVSLRQYSI